jgi:hypothetical protein
MFQRSDIKAIVIEQIKKKSTTQSRRKPTMIFQQFTQAGMAAALVPCRVLIFVYASFGEATLLLAESLPKKGYPYVSEGSVSHA